MFRWSDIKDILCICCIVALVVVTGCIAVFSVVDFMQASSCKSYQKVTGVQTQYINWDACYVKTPDGWKSQREYFQSAAKGGV